MESRMEEKLIKAIQDMAGRYSPYEVFCDWLRCCAISIANATSPHIDPIYQQRELQWKDTMSRYSRQEQDMFGEMLGMLIMALEEDIRDVIGDVYMKAGIGNKTTGQFFTPFNLSLLTAEMALPKEIKQGERITLNEPSSGCGGMIIAAAKIIKQRGLNYQKVMDVVAQDIDHKAVYGTYVQLSLLGIKAVVVQGDTLSEPFTDIKRYQRDRIWETPARKGLLL